MVDDGWSVAGQRLRRQRSDVLDGFSHDAFGADGPRERGDVGTVEIHSLRLDATDSQALQDIGSHFKNYAGGFEATLARIASGDVKTTQEANAELSKVKAAVHGMETASDAMSDRAAARAAGVGAQIEAVRGRAQMIQIGLTIAGVLLAVVMCVVLTRSITRPIA